MLNVQDSSKYMKFFKNKVVACEQRVKLTIKMYSLQESSYIIRICSNML